MLTIDLDLAEIDGDQKVLDAGCGDGRHTWQVCKSNKGLSIAFDLDLASLMRAKFVLSQMDERLETIGAWDIVSGSITSLPFADGCFDRVICSEVLEHIPLDYNAVAELRRVLKPGGVLAVSVPSYLTESICWRISEDYHNTPGGHIRIYRQSEILGLLQNCDLNVYAVRHKHAFHSVYWWLKGLFGLKNAKALVPSVYYRFLVWDIYSRHKYTKWLEDALNHAIPKSTVIYCRKPIIAPGH
jgi:ubiquinone/menaquinone biosynthesis C-methylase UbiE